MSGYHKRTDASHRAVIDRLRSYGWLVFDTHALPGFVDAIASIEKTETFISDDGRVATTVKRRIMQLVEIKSRTGKHTDSQQALMKAGWSILTLRSAADVDALMGVKS